MGPMSVLRGLLGIRAFRTVSLHTRAAIWDLTLQYGYDGSSKVVSVLYLWSPAYVGGSLSDWPQFGLLCCLQPMVIYFWNETNKLLEMAIGALSFVTIGEKYVYWNITGLPLLSSANNNNQQQHSSSSSCCSIATIIEDGGSCHQHHKWQPE